MMFTETKQWIWQNSTFLWQKITLNYNLMMKQAALPDMPYKNQIKPNSQNIKNQKISERRREDLLLSS